MSRPNVTLNLGGVSMQDQAINFDRLDLSPEKREFYENIINNGFSEEQLRELAGLINQLVTKRSFVYEHPISNWHASALFKILNNSNPALQSFVSSKEIKNLSKTYRDEYDLSGMDITQSALLKPDSKMLDKVATEVVDVVMQAFKKLHDLLCNWGDKKTGMKDLREIVDERGKNPFTADSKFSSKLKDGLIESLRQEREVPEVSGQRSRVGGGLPNPNTSPTIAGTTQEEKSVFDSFLGALGFGKGVGKS